MINKLLIDLDDTLLDFYASEEIAIKKVLKKFHLEVTSENIALYDQINRSYWKKLERKEVEKEELFLLRFIDFFAHFHKEINAKEVNDYYFSYLSKYGFILNHSDLFLKKAKGKNYQIIIVSNGAKRVQDTRIENSNLKPYFDQIYLSEEVGYEKPDKRFFLEIEKKYPDLKSTSIIIGDSLTSDILGGINYGIPTIWYNPKNKLGNITPDYQISSLDEVFPLLEQINKKS